MSVTLAPGREVSITGVRGRFTVQTIDADRGEVTVYGGPPGRAMFRTFRLDRVAVIHRTTKRKGLTDG